MMDDAWYHAVDDLMGWVARDARERSGHVSEWHVKPTFGVIKVELICNRWTSKMPLIALCWHQTVTFRTKKKSQ